MPISRDTIDIIRDRSRIEDVVRRYVPSLVKRGNSFVGLCPFHKEKTPSFTVSPEKQFFYCFGCQAGGNVFSFVSKMERLSFPESVRFLGKLAGIDVREEKDDGRGDTLDYFRRINSFAAETYHQVLLSDRGKIAMDYALRRGLTAESIKEFKLGFAPDSWNYLSDRLARKNVTLAMAAKLGLVAESTKGQAGHYYDRFRNRLIFPIFDQRGEAIAFGGRVIGEGEPKYLNSPESDLFSKGNVLYGINVAREHIIELKRAIVVEGYLDVIGCHQNGVKNVVAPLGTALTERHVEMLSRYCTEIILLFDADSAGLNASLRSLTVAGEKNVDVRVALLPEGDPFDFITGKGVRPFMAVVDSALQPVDFKIQRALIGPPDEPRIRVLVRMFEILNEIPYETEKRVYIKKISSILGLDERSLFDDYNKYSRGRRNPDDVRNLKAPVDDRLEYLSRCHRELVLLLLNHPEIIENALLDFSADAMTDPVAKSVFTRITELDAAGEPISIDRIFDDFHEGPEREFLEKALEKSFVLDNPKESYNEIYINIKIYRIDLKIEKFMNDIKNSKDGNTGSNLAEIEILRRDKEKILSYMHGRKS